MDRFYLENATLYQHLVKAYNAPVENPPTMTNTPDMVVCARIRPLLEEEHSAGFPCAAFRRRAKSNTVDIHDLYNHPRGRPVLKSFDYEVDKLFDASAATQEIYDSVVMDLIPFAYNGGIGTLFTYGQTGSGKTFTVSQLQKLVAGSLMNGNASDLRQIYLTIIDLAGNSAADLLDSRNPVSILEDSFGVTQMAGATEHLIRSQDEMNDLIERAAAFRKTQPTLKNDNSSRSHAICRIRIQNPATESEGLLYLIDLAGSEAARDVALHGAERMREAREINMSLSVLKDCIRGKVEFDLANKLSGPKTKKRKPHIPFRQSALTKVLKHVFDPAESRDCKTVVIVCLNPSLADVGPTKNTLRYAEMLRFLVPILNKVTANGDLDLAKPSSRPVDSPSAALPFSERIRPGMVISLRQSPGERSNIDIREELHLAVVLCPEQILTRYSSDEVAGTKGTVAGYNKEDGLSYLCASFAPVSAIDTYELNLWKQISVNVNMIDREVILEYDAEDRYYHVVA